MLTRASFLLIVLVLLLELTRYENRLKKRRRFDPAKHGRWQNRLATGKTVSWVDEFLVSERSSDPSVPSRI